MVTVSNLFFKKCAYLRTIFHQKVALHHYDEGDQSSTRMLSDSYPHPYLEICDVCYSEEKL